MQITILDRDDRVRYDEIPPGGTFLWRHENGDEYRLFVKPSADLQINGIDIQAVEINRGTAAKFDNFKERVFLPVIIKTLEVELK